MGKHGHDHTHDHGNLKGRNLGIAILLNIGITVAQVVGGFISGSLALLSDALHNFSDVLALVISWFASKLAGRKQTARQTFGYKRAEILAALINAVSLIVIAFFLLKEAVERLGEPQEIQSGLVMILGGLSIVLNGASVLLVVKDAKNNINMRSAYLHLLSDMVSSIAVVLGGFVMYMWEVSWVDSVLSIAIALYLVYSSWGLIVESVRIIMQFAPIHIDLEEVQQKVKSVKEIENIHHVHVWQLDDKQINFEAHISFKEDMPLSEVNKVLREVEHILHDDFEINHVTLQPEINGYCQDESLVKQEKPHSH
ncbi:MULTISPECIES: cation diffusion facilitator family transporter [Marinifilum]|jgi:cobalt-zinc-cadmium efflux system protein|uniref:cation diffusion facilitator family transporter n=1 Tax=Marinifilum TaxID=866673 RepID=UPI0022745652|nr:MULTISPECIES: cation diffusion facilitator family transporter [Marinifilum]MCY1636605.1 cation diffusion facilitator family transporter [Marinifilum sp. D737]